MTRLGQANMSTILLIFYQSLAHRLRVARTRTIVVEMRKEMKNMRRQRS